MKPRCASVKSLWVLLLCLNAAPSAAAARRKPRLPAGLVIASIQIETHEVFDTSAPPENKLLYQVADHIHRQTRDPVIARELLFAVGDRYDPALIEETERNLRSLSFIRRADIAATVNEEGAVDVIVRTYDSWTLQIVASFKRAGGNTNFQAGLAESNILGEGKAVSAVYNRTGAAESKSFSYSDPQFLDHKHLQYSMVAIESPGSQNYSLSLNRPFFASIAPSAFGGTIGFVKTPVQTFTNGSAVGQVSQRTASAGINYGVAFATSTERVQRVTFGLLEQHFDYRPIAYQGTGPMPDREQLGFLQVSGDWQEVDFIKVRRIQKFTHDEDYNLGLEVVPAVWWAPAVPALGTTQTQLLPSVTATKGFTWSDQLLFLSAAYSSKYVDGGNGNRLAAFNATYYVRGLRYQTLAFHTALDLGWRLDPASPLTLGEANGLRGYGLSAFTGDRSALFNVEDRIYVWDELWRLLDVGAVVFFDSGYAWASSTPVNMVNLRDSVGFGLRLAPSRSANNGPVRIDMARALSNNESRSRWSLSILAGQAFN